MTRTETADFLARQDHFCIISHARPDGDSIGSTSALCLGLRKLGKTAHVLYNREITDYLSFCYEGLSKPQPEEGDTLVTVDVASPNMLPLGFEYLADRVQLRIDHHASATSFTPLELVDAKAGACGEIVYDLLVQLGVPLDQDIAKRLYIAITTDTGCFRFANTTAHTYQVAAACAETGADLYPITQTLFDTNSLQKLRLRSWMIEHTTFLGGGIGAVCAIPRAMEQGQSVEDLEGLPGFLRSIKGVKISATIRETDVGGTKISARAIPGYDATAICARFGGGGHTGAAGARTSMPLEEAKKAVEAVVAELLEEK